MSHQTGTLFEDEIAERSVRSFHASTCVPPPPHPSPPTSYPFQSIQWDTVLIGQETVPLSCGMSVSFIELFSSRI